MARVIGLRPGSPLGRAPASPEPCAPARAWRPDARVRGEADDPGDELLVGGEPALRDRRCCLQPDAHVAAHRYRGRRQRKLAPADPGDRPGAPSGRSATSRRGGRRRRRAPPGRPARSPACCGNGVCLRREPLRVEEVTPIEYLEFRPHSEARQFCQDPARPERVFEDSSPKLTVPQVSVAISGRSAAARPAPRGHPDRPAARELHNQIAMRPYRAR